MQCLWVPWSICVFFCCVVQHTTGLRLAACSGDRDAVELTENISGQRTTCEDIAQNQQLEWAFRINGSVRVLATCNTPNQPCDIVNPTILTATRDMSSSTATFVANATRQTPGGAAGYSGYDVICRYGGGGGSGVSCPVDIVYAPSSAEINCRTEIERWNVTLTCDISKAYSSLNRYRCEAAQESSTGSRELISTYNTGVSDGYVSSAVCSLTFPIHAQSAAYNHTMLVFPGATRLSLLPLSVARPSTDPSIDCNTQGGGYIAENAALDCTCVATDRGNPSGRLYVTRDNRGLVATGSFDEQSVRFELNNVRREDDGAVFTCVQDWATADSDDRSTTFVLKVAYGPTSVNLTDPPVHDLHPTQSPQPLTLTCSAVDVKPHATYSWSGSQCAHTTQSTCSFVPVKEDNGDVISCTAVNSVTNVRRTSDERTLRIHYPPPSAPVFGGYSGNVLYAGNTVNLTCTVIGGNPPASSVTLTCGSGGQEVSGVNGTLQVTASRDYNGELCTCRAQWENKPAEWYSQTASVTLQVYYPPAAPTIEHGQQPYPFLEGDTPSLNCTLPDDPGNPPATLTFEGQTGTLGQGEVSVILGVLTSADNGRRVTCELTTRSLRTARLLSFRRGSFRCTT
ncbi:nephrin-like isoform X1 [Babylonia areolata]|uniref:nephrin-like isoform X1 n=1 Tax=Babylonia areolata TaxID=304850 RepID=UPI003FD13D2A